VNSLLFHKHKLRILPIINVALVIFDKELSVNYEKEQILKEILRIQTAISKTKDASQRSALQDEWNLWVGRDAMRTMDEAVQAVAKLTPKEKEEAQNIWDDFDQFQAMKAELEDKNSSLLSRIKLTFNRKKMTAELAAKEGSLLSRMKLPFKR
jgi:alpha-L-arabinofuranosidase